MITIDYTYYKNTYGGFLDEATFNKFVQRAYMTIDSFCFGNYEKSDESNYSEFQLSKIKTCVCAVTDKLNAVTGVDGTFSSGVTESETVGPWSVKYSTKSLPSSVYASLKELIFSYLSTTNLMVAWC
jgi:hypothetical protein